MRWPKERGLSSARHMSSRPRPARLSFHGAVPSSQGFRSGYTCETGPVGHGDTGRPPPGRGRALCSSEEEEAFEQPVTP